MLRERFAKRELLQVVDFLSTDNEKFFEEYVSTVAGVVKEQERVAAILAVDIGGTKLAAAVVDLDGKIILRDRVPTPA